MSRGWPSRALALATALLLAQACTAAPPDPAASGQPSTGPHGGTLRLAVYGDELTFNLFPNPDGHPAALDPHLDAFGADSAEAYRCCLARTLLSTNGRATEEDGVHLLPDLAAEQPVISDDGLSWTFTLREGLRYGPPLEDVEITAHDIVRSFHRLLAPALVAPPPGHPASYGASLFTDIVGAQAYLDGEAESISGLETPDSHTLVIRLTSPAGDLGARLAIPLAVPIPASPTDPGAPFGIATGHDDGYGRFAVSSGPYMIEGSQELDFSRPAAEQEPVAGLVAGQRLALVRNPSWDAATDRLRPALADRIEFTVFADLAGAAAAVYDGEAHLLLNFGSPPMPPEISEAVEADPALAKINLNQSDTIGSVMLNVAQPPFDDIEVRRAVAFAVDRASIAEVVGPYILRPAHHVVPDAMVDNLLVDYRPYPSSGDHGDIEAAKGHMRQSGYDSDADGLCDAPACRGVVAYTRDQGFFAQIAESVREDLSALGIELDVQVKSPEEYFGAYEDPTSQVAMFLPLGWVKDSLSPASFFIGSFYSPVALTEIGNGSMVGASPEQLAQWGYETTSVPSVDERIEACLPLVGAASYECWAGLDQHMMENVMASVPFGLGVGPILTANNVEEYVWDQLVGSPSFDQIVVAPQD